MKKSRKEQREAARKRMNNDIQSTKSNVNLLNLEEYENVQFFKITKEEAEKRKKFDLDILPYIITTEKHTKGVEIGFVDYKLEYWRHQNIGPNNQTILCLSKTYDKPCPICELYETLKDELGWDHKDTKAVKAKRRTIMNIIDLANEEKGIQVWDVSWHIFDSLLLVEVDDFDSEEQLLFYDIEEGKTIRIRSFLDNMGGTKFASIDKLDFIDREPLNDTIEEETYPLDALIEIPTYKEVKKLISVIDDNEEEEKEVSNKTKRKTKKVEKEEVKEESKEKATKRTRTRRKTKEEDNTNKCTSNHVFGTDCNEKEECADCDEVLFESCSDEFDKLSNENQ